MRIAAVVCARLLFKSKEDSSFEGREYEEPLGFRRIHLNRHRSRSKFASTSFRYSPNEGHRPTAEAVKRRIVFARSRGGRLRGRAGVCWIFVLQRHTKWPWDGEPVY